MKADYSSKNGLIRKRMARRLGAKEIAPSRWPDLTYEPVASLEVSVGRLQNVSNPADYLSWERGNPATTTS
jgi:hypothetical protein